MYPKQTAAVGPRHALINNQQVRDISGSTSVWDLLRPKSMWDLLGLRKCSYH